MAGGVRSGDLSWNWKTSRPTYPSIKALRKAADEFEVYIRSNAGMIPNYAERRRYGERVSTGFVESAHQHGCRQTLWQASTDAVVERWGSSHAAGPTRTLDGTLRGKFEQWYPGLKAGDRSVEAEQLAA